ncbi:MAG: thiamine pyrophosphate-dependent enzyme, partial [Clostridia bacterium]|nr:thiamine pyrophosphate-dependent enzyme [Clostridia bacterium]
FDDRVTGNTQKFIPHARIIHIDIDSAEIGKNIEANIPLVGDLKIIINQILECLDSEKKLCWWNEVLSCECNDNKISNINDHTREIEEHTSVEEGKLINEEKMEISPQDVMSTFNKIISPDTIITTDVGQHQLWAAQSIKFRKTRTFISSGGLGTMGYGIPAAVGAQIAFPNRDVVVITGDGSFQMGMAELGTCLDEELPLKIIILNNGALGMVKQLQDHYCQGRYSAVYFKKSPDFQGLAKCYGALGLRVENREELSKKMEEFIHHPGLAILEVRISSEHGVYPMVLGGKGLDEMINGKNGS